MAKQIKKANTVKKNEKVVSANIDGLDTELKVQTGCKTFGKILLNGEGDLTGKCKTCAKKNPDVTEACSFQSNPAGFEIKETVKRTANSDLETCVSFVMANHDSMTRKAIVAELAKDSDRSAGGWKTMVGAICLSMKHLNEPGSGAYGAAARGILNNGITNFKELKKYVAGQEDKTEGAVGRSVQYVWTTWKNL